MDFVHDQLATGNKIRILTVVDTFSRYSPAVVPRFSFRAPDVIETLDRVCKKIGYPKNIRVDQGSEVVSKEFDQWAYYHDVILQLAAPPFGSADQENPPTMPTTSIGRTVPLAIGNLNSHTRSEQRYIGKSIAQLEKKPWIAGQ